MKKAIIGKKVGMTQIFDESGRVIPVTVIEAGPCVVVQKKTEDNDGYTAVQLGYGDVKDKHLSKPEATRKMQRDALHILQAMNGIHPGDPTYSTELDPENYRKTM